MPASLRTCAHRARRRSGAGREGTPNGNTAEGENALFSLTTGQLNTSTGSDSLFSNTTGGINTATGASALSRNTTGAFNTATGGQSLFHNISGSDNVAAGYSALFSNRVGLQNTGIGNYSLAHNIQGNDNTAEGYLALTHNTTGSNNIAVGASAGLNLTTGSNNIDVGSPGVRDESSTIRIGKKNDQHATYIAGIHGATTASMDAVPVVIDSDGQLGTVSSSARFKDEIKPMDKSSEAVLALKPVTFHYKSDVKGTAQFGLIAEEVAKVDPDLVVREQNGQPYTVRYEAVNAMLLNEFLKEHLKVEELGRELGQQREVNAELRSTTALQEKQISGLAQQIEKISAQITQDRVAPEVRDK